MAPPRTFRGRLTKEEVRNARERIVSSMWESGHNTWEISNALREMTQEDDWSEAEVDDFIYNKYIAAKRKHP